MMGHWISRRRIYSLHDSCRQPPIVPHSSSQADSDFVDMTFTTDTNSSAASGADTDLLCHLQHMGLALVEWDQDLRVRQWSAAAERLLGRSCAEAMGRSLAELDLFVIEDQATLQRELGQMCSLNASGGSRPVVLRHAADDQGVQFSEWNLSVAGVQRGDRPVVCLVRDVTKQVLEHERLSDCVERFDLAIRGASVGIWDWDISTGCVHWSDRLFRQLGYQPSELQPTFDTFLSFLHPADVERTQAALNATIDGGRPLDMELRMRRKDGQYRWFRARGAVQSRVDGTFQRMAGSLEDIQEQKQTEQALCENEERLRLVFNQQFQFIAVLSADGVVLDINDLPLKVQGASREDYLGRPFWQSPGWKEMPDWQQIIKSRVLAALESADPVHAEDEFLAADGSRHYATATYTAIRDADGSARYVLVQASDVTERRQVEESLRRSEVRFRKLVEHAPEAVVLLDVDDGLFFMLNRAAEKLFRCPSSELIGKSPLDLSPERQPDGRPSEVAAGEYIQQACDGGMPCFEWVHCDMDGRHVLCEVRLLALDVDDRLVVRGSILDISDRKRAERALHESENLFRGAFEDAVTPCALLESNGRYIRVNDAFCRMVGRSRAELMGVHYYQITHPDDLGPDAEENQQLFMGEANSYSGREKRYVHRDGHYVWAMISISMVRGPQGEPLYRILQAQEITERKRIESELEETRAILSAAIEASPAGIIIADAPDARIRSVNAAALAICGAQQTDITELPFPYYRDRWNCRHPDGTPFDAEQMPLTRAIREGVVSRNVDVLIERPDGEEHWVLGNAAPVRNAEGEIVAGVVVFPDVTEQKRAAAALRQSEAELAHVMRLSSMGEMVGGIAHELNQPLYAVQNYSKACANLLNNEEPADYERLFGWLNRISEAAVHAGAVLQRLRDFVRQKPANRVLADLNEVIETAISFVRYEAEQRNVAVTVTTAAHPVRAKVDSVQIQQVLMNLVLNAFDAVRELQKPPAIEIVVQNLQDTAEVVVSDNGIGLPHDAEMQIFKAFHSTKPNGMGLGLAIATTIIESHRGSLVAGNNPGGGASFRFTLPLAMD